MAKFKHGDLVWIKPLHKSKAHFPQEKRAIILRSFWDIYGYGSKKTYSLNVEKDGRTSWYDEQELEMIRPAIKCPCCDQFIPNKF